MRYLSSYRIIKESVAEAKSFWSKKFPDRENYLLPIFQKVFHKNPGYIGPFMKLLFRHYDYANTIIKSDQFVSVLRQGDPLEHDKVKKIIEIYNLLIKYKQIFNQINIDEFKTIEELDDYVNNTIKTIEDKNYTKQFFSSKYFHLINDKTVKLFCIIRDNLKFSNDQVKELIMKKIAAYHNSEELNRSIKSIIDLNGDWNVEALEGKANSFGANIIFKDEQVLIVETPEYDCMRRLGSPSWCIVREEGYFEQYTEYTDYATNFKANMQYIIFDTSKEQTNNHSMIGVTVNYYGKVEAAHLLNDDEANEKDYSVWLEYLKPMSKEELESYASDCSIEFAIRAGLLDTVKKLINDGDSIDQHEVCMSVKVKNIDMFNLLMKHFSRGNYVNFIFTEICQYNFYQAIDYIFSNFELEKITINYGFKHAIRYESKECIEYILKHSTDLEPLGIKDKIELKKSEKGLEILDILVKDGRFPNMIYKQEE